MARQKAEDWRARLGRFEASGLTVAEFSLRERVDARQLRSVSPFGEPRRRLP